MLIPARPPIKNTPRIDFPPEEFRKHLYSKGLRARWEQAAECPCRRKGGGDLVGATSSMVDILTAAGKQGVTGEGRYECPACHGRGYLYHSAQDIIAIFTRVSGDPKGYLPWGEWTKGMAGLTVLPEHVPAFQDRITLTDSVLVYRETLQRKGAVEGLRYPIVTRALDTTPDPLSVGVLYCIKASATGLVDPVGGVMVEDTDFTVTEAGKISWIDGNGGSPPAVGDFYSISYYAAPRYVVVDIPHAFRDTWVGTKVATPYFAPMLIHALCQLEFLLTREEPDGE